MQNQTPLSKSDTVEQPTDKGLDATICSSLARYLSEQQDAAIRQAINNHLGREDWSIEEVIPRLALCTYQGSDLQTITMDGEPIISIGPVEMNTEERGRSTFLRATRGYKILNETNVIGVATADKTQQSEANKGVSSPLPPPSC